MISRFILERGKATDIAVRENTGPTRPLIDKREFSTAVAGDRQALFRAAGEVGEAYRADADLGMGERGLDCAPKISRGKRMFVGWDSHSFGQRQPVKILFGDVFHGCSLLCIKRKVKLF